MLEGNDPGGRAFALILRPHPGAFRQLMCPHPGEFAYFFKKMLMPGVRLERLGICLTQNQTAFKIAYFFSKVFFSTFRFFSWPF